MESFAHIMITLTATLGLAACSPSQPASPSPSGASAEHGPLGRIDIAVTADGFVAAGNRIKVGQPVTLVVTRKVERTCATEIVIKEYGIEKPLPHGQPVEVTFTPTKAGKIRYACAMDMIAGELVAE